MALSTVRSVKLTFCVGDLRLVRRDLSILPFHSSPPSVSYFLRAQGRETCIDLIGQCPDTKNSRAPWHRPQVVRRRHLTTSATLLPILAGPSQASIWRT